MYTKSFFVNWIKREMAGREWSQADLARAAKVTSAAISDLLNGKRAAGPDMCIGLSKAFNVPPEDVFRYAGLLPPAEEKTQKVRQIDHIAQQLPEEEQERLRSIGEALLRSAREREASKRAREKKPKVIGNS